ncbi:MAG TPA: DNA gyrase inhibitor YacG [Xanthobacteraceae bacterium]
MTKDTTKEIAADAARARRCPICGKPAVAQFRAFCSRRCADIDLNRWLSGVYAVPGKAEEEEDGGPNPAPDDAA